MEHSKKVFPLGIGLVLMVLLISSCDSSSGSNADPIGPDLRGDTWAGFYFRTDAAVREAVTGRIDQDGNAFFLTTSKADAPGQHFTGSMDEAGQLTLTDASDGETWTSRFGPASANQLKIAQAIGGSASALQVIELAR